MAKKPNFNYEKNRREQDKKKKREEKRQRKLGRSDSGQPEQPHAAGPDGPPAEPTE